MRVFIFVGCWFVCCAVVATPTDLDKLVQQWVQLEQQINNVKASWRERKPLLNQQLQLLKAENQSLSAFLVEDTADTDELDKRRLALLRQQTELEQTQNTISSQLQKVEQILLRIHPQLPPPLKQQWDTELALLTSMTDNSERVGKQLYLLDSMQKYNHRIVTHQTSMTFANQVEVQVEQVFLGTSKGWYVSQDGQYWGSGHSSPGGWQWQHQEKDLSPSILLDLVKAIKNVSQAQLIRLPLTTGIRQNEN
ncbi:DUF3450 family protein [Aliiglaciecola sp. NS0011-25]|uniref:DUF3450 family protein n=1 Tax=Aliiglaciecola sp. NS0011-25 TaxID=3127654 RepID=UPI00310B8D0E